MQKGFHCKHWRVEINGNTGFIVNALGQRTDMRQKLQLTPIKTWASQNCQKTILQNYIMMFAFKT